MRILFDSKQLTFKTPFGTLIPGQECTLRIHIPETVQTEKAACIMCHHDGSTAFTVTMPFAEQIGCYQVFQGSFSCAEPGLYFYYFYITTPNGGFRLFKYGNDTNMEDGALWQLSCVPADFHTPDWSKGATIYQIFPDRFHKSGECDLTGKLQPYAVHSDWHEEVSWQPDAQGNILNNDFFGGNFRGITEKMDYIASLGTTILYLNPISKSFSNHRYDTGDYKIPDPMLGTLEDFKVMCDAAHERGIKVILDGVYSHTGSRSPYFESACQSPDSPYYSWYTFYQYPHQLLYLWGY